MSCFTGIFFMLHGFVHLLYMGHSLNYFELEKNFSWPDNSLVLKKISDKRIKKEIAAALCVIAALFFIISGILTLTGHLRTEDWIIAAVVASTGLFILFWNGRLNKLHTQGGIAVLINLGILFITLIINPK